MSAHFCTCPAVDCPQHPSVHGGGCDHCIKDNLEKMKMPACFFQAVHEDTSELTDYKIEDFVAFYLRHHGNPTSAK